MQTQSPPPPPRNKAEVRRERKNGNGNDKCDNKQKKLVFKFIQLSCISDQVPKNPRVPSRNKPESWVGKLVQEDNVSKIDKSL